MASFLLPVPGAKNGWKSVLGWIGVALCIVAGFYFFGDNSFFTSLNKGYEIFFWIGFTIFWSLLGIGLLAELFQIIRERFKKKAIEKAEDNYFTYSYVPKKIKTFRGNGSDDINSAYFLD